ncbi:MAG: sodium:solute symporter family protein [Treponema sp.]|nr:sodium:solute symporter family protein [Treponema sp.]
MNSIFLIALALYLLVFIAIGLRDIKNIRTFTDYSTAGKRQGLFPVVMTLLATMLGASTTIGITDTVYKIGFPGIWWLVFGAAGLVLQSLLISERVRKIDADTLPDLAGKTAGQEAQLLIATVIVVSWVGVIAGQLVAMNNLITFALGMNSRAIFAVVALIVIAYTMTGGQLSVVKTDKIQLAIIMAGIVSCTFFLYFIKGGNTADIPQNMELLNSSYRPFNLFMQFFIIGGVYFLGPDILSRNFISKDGATAKKSAFTAGLVLLAFAFLITMTGMWLRFNTGAEELAGKSALLHAVSLLPRPLAVVLLFGLLSAILSSTDTCLINASSILAKDILKKDRVTWARMTVLLLGLLALALALWGKGDILSLLTGAYSVYTPGVIFPLTVAIFAHTKYGVKKGIWLCAVAAGGLFGLAGTYFTAPLLALGLPAAIMQYLTLIGMGLSLLLSLLSVNADFKSIFHPQAHSSGS